MKLVGNYLGLDSRMMLHQYQTENELYSMSFLAIIIC